MVNLPRAGNPGFARGSKPVAEVYTAARAVEWLIRLGRVGQFSITANNRGATYPLRLWRSRTPLLIIGTRCAASPHESNTGCSTMYKLRQH